MDLTELLEAAGNSCESSRLEPKWLRVTNTYLTKVHEQTEWIEAAKDSSLERNKVRKYDNFAGRLEQTEFVL